MCVRVVWLFTSATLSLAVLLNLIYLVTPRASHAELAAAIPITGFPVAEDTAADPCTLSDVFCDNEVRPSVTPSGYERTLTRPISGVIKKGAPAWMQERIDYAWSKGNDLDFILMLEVENAGSWSVDKLSDLVGANGFRDKGICQVNIGWHPKVVNDPQFKDWKWQVDTCWKMYKGGVRFYGYDVRHRALPRFILAKQ